MKLVRCTVTEPILHILSLQLSEDIGYVLYSALGSFYLPSCIMVFVYIRIYYAAKKRARRGINKKSRKLDPVSCLCSLSLTTDQLTNSVPRFLHLQSTRFTSITSYPMPSVPENSSSSHQHIAIIENAPMSSDKQPTMNIPTVTCDLAESDSNNENSSSNNNKQTDIELNTLTEETGQEAGADGELVTTTHITTTTTIHHLQVLPLASLQRTTNGHQHISPTLQRCRAFSVGVDSDMVSEFDPSSSDSGVASRCSSVKPSKFRIFHPIFSRRYQREMDVNRHNPSELEPVINKADQRPRDPEKEKRRIARQKEKRATLILGVIMGCFIACWLPFFFLYILIPACKTRCNIPDFAFTFAFWLGYMNSAFNPVIYTIFNKDFRRAFRRILFK